MGKARWFLPMLVLCLLVQRPAIGQQPIHWEATIDSAKAAAGQSNRLVLVLFSAPWCTACHHLENDIRNQPGAAAALEANFVPVKINYDYYPNTAKQYGVTRLPTTVILAPNPRGEVLAVIPEYMPVGQYLSMINKVAADARRRDAGLFAQIQASPPVGAPAAVGSLPAAGTAAPANSAPANQAAVAPRMPAGPTQTQPQAPALPPASAPAADAKVAMTTGAGLAASRPLNAQKPAEKIQRPANPPFGLEGFCPVQLVENFRWQEGQKTWGAIHRGRTYLFTGAEERRRFLAAPDRYAPVSSGDDVVLLLEQGRSVSGYRAHGLQFDGHVYLFASESTLEKFRSNPHYYADRALQALRPSTQTAAVR